MLSWFAKYAKGMNSNGKLLKINPQDVKHDHDSLIIWGQIAN